MIQHYFLGAWVPVNDAPYTYYTRALPRDLYILGMKAAEELRVAPQSSQSGHRTHPHRRRLTLTLYGE